MGVILDFLRPSGWKIGVFLFLSLWLLFPTILHYVPNCEIVDGVTVRCNDSTLESLLGIGFIVWFFSSFLMFPITMPMRFIGIFLPRPLVGPGLPSIMFIIVYSYFFSCLTFFIVKSIRKRRSNYSSPTTT